MPGISSRRRRCQPSIALVLLDHERARADEAHLAAHDVEQLRQLVQRGACAASRPTRVTRGSSAILNRPSCASLRSRSDVLHRLGVGDHRAELEHVEALAVAADAQLAEEHRAAAVELDRDRDRDQQRRDREQPERGADEVEGALEARPRSASGRSGGRPSRVTPCRSSNSTEEPTTSSRRGSTLTRTPTAFSVRTRLSISPASALRGAMIARCTSSVWARSRISASRGVGERVGRPRRDLVEVEVGDDLGLDPAVAGQLASGSSPPTAHRR